ncbi:MULTISPECIES: aromatic alcohol reductase [unclassified Nostoc]|uniref:aromatic alcohol reductase n=1 Tax=unclassified Nostoc TaxID=2593658 RepID=UPI002AD3A32B|nr:MULTISPECIES: aromatic alcohol reductase [unclassified Nostoc]MDZ8031225.1 aromatic alcohol reductase [Nostoc sp. DedSLP04]MDZ8137328.1 aromatic alcohol reductase [Nostoc sp. DedQUE04]
MTTKLTVLVAGSTGMLGSKIVSALLDKSNLDIRAMVRSINDSSAKNRQKIEAMQAKGVTIAEGDLMKPETLLSVCDGVDVVVSAIGNNDVTVPGQKNLIDAAKQQGVKRFIPSDYSVDYRKLDYGDNDNLDMRKEVFEYLQLMGLEYTLVLNGAFMEFITYMPLFDLEHQIFQYWGDGETPLDLTTTDDTAKYVAEAVSDPSLGNTALSVAGDTLTAKQLKATYEAATGSKLTEKSLGSIAEMKAWIANKKASASSREEYVYHQYMYAMVSGKGKLDRIGSDRYPHIKPKTVKQFLSKGNS